ncbi:MAG: nucleotidyltransferase domain-containing protein [Nanoarchaeota archaeon]|nr:nucleotidyltransferase domain-containing protein [Nanoarchaeota archaeon]
MIVDILNNKSVGKLLILLSYSPGAGYSRGEIMKLMKWNNLSLDRTLKKLEFHKVITKDGRTIKLNFASEETKKLMELIEYDKKKLNFPSFEIFIVLVEFVRLAEGNKIEEIYLFGSHAKKTASVNSDIDIAVFSKEKINLIEAKDAISEEFGKEIQLHYFKIGEKSKLVDEVKKHGVRLI